MVEHDEVVAAYRLLLGRDPESEGVIEHMSQEPTLQALGARLMRSDEFRRRASIGDMPKGTERWVCAEIRHGLRIWTNLMDLGVGAGVLRDDWEPAETQFVLSQLDSGDCFLDVGANIGWFSVLAGHKVGPTGRVVSFEPRPDLFRRLRDTIAANGMRDRCKLHGVALGDAETEMVIAAVPNEHNPGHSFLVREVALAEEVPYGRVKVCRLDDLDIDRLVNLIKIDVEGAEGMVLRGAQNFLRRDRPFIVSEFFPTWLEKVSAISPGEYLGLLRDCGYRIYELTDKGVGDLITDLPLGVDREGFFTNVVAAPDEKTFKAFGPNLPQIDFSQPARVVDEGFDGQAHRIYDLEIAVRSTDLGLRDLSKRIDHLTAEMRASATQPEARTGIVLQKVDESFASCISKIEESMEANQRSFEHQQRALHDRLERGLKEIARTSGKKKKRLLTKIIRELKKPFTRRFWEREREKRAARLLARHSLTPQSPEPEGMRTWEDVANSRAKVPCLRGIEKPVVMVIDHRWPEPDRDSGSLDAVNMVRCFLECGYHVLFSPAEPTDQEARYIEELRMLKAWPLTEADAPSARAFIEQHGSHVDLFVLSRVTGGARYFELIRYNCPHAKIIFNTVDLHYLRETRAARISGDPEALEKAEKTRDREEFLVANSDLTYVVSTVEEEILQASLPGVVTVVMPLSRRVRHPRTSFENRSGIGFIGGFEHLPNIDALCYFLDEVWPKLILRDPSINFEIVGSKLPLEVLNGIQGDVTYLGPLPSVDDWFDSLKMSIAPLRIGAGAKGKVASSLCNGLPCVMTSVAAEGMRLEVGKHAMVGDTTDELVEMILQLHSDPELWARLSQGGLDFAKANLSISHFDDIIRGSLIKLELPAFSASTIK